MQAAGAQETLLWKVTLLLPLLFILLVTITNPISRLQYYSNLVFLSNSNFHEILSLLMNRNYVFLLCNGILIVIAKSSGKVFVDDDDDMSLSSSSSSQLTQLVEITNLSSSDDDDHHHRFDNFLNSNAQVMPSQGDHQELINKMEWNKEVFIEEEEEIELEYESSSDDDDGEQGDEDEGEDEDEEEESSIARMSIEELNRKFEDFIRRMKEEIRIEAQTQLVMV